MAAARDSSYSANASRQIALRHSIAVRAATLVFALVAALAVHYVVAPRGGQTAAAVLAAATFGALTLAALACERRRPVAICLEPDGIAAYGRLGGTLLRGRIAGCSQWADRLLLIAIMPHGGERAVPLIVAADSLSAEAFRELAVRARHAAR